MMHDLGCGENDDDAVELDDNYQRVSKTGSFIILWRTFADTSSLSPDCYLIMSRGFASAVSAVYLLKLLQSSSEYACPFPRNSHHEMIC